MKRAAFFLSLLLGLTCTLFADEGLHHEDLTETQLGTVHFPVSCDASVQKPFQRGVALLHSFWYEEAGKEFEHIAQDDPRCAMAHWGIAMSSWHQLWDHPGKSTLDAGLAEVKKARALHPRTPRERDYIDAIGAFFANPDKSEYQARATAYSNAMEKVYHRYSDDKEAAAFYA